MENLKVMSIGHYTPLDARKRFGEWVDRHWDVRFAASVKHGSGGDTFVPIPAVIGADILFSVDDEGNPNPEVVMLRFYNLLYTKRAMLPTMSVDSMLVMGDAQKELAQLVKDLMGAGYLFASLTDVGAGIAQEGDSGGGEGGEGREDRPAETETS